VQNKDAPICIGQRSSPPMMNNQLRERRLECGTFHLDDCDFFAHHFKSDFPEMEPPNPARTFYEPTRPLAMKRTQETQLGKRQADPRGGVLVSQIAIIADAHGSENQGQTIMAPDQLHPHTVSNTDRRAILAATL
jgi:hypothetical protein